MNVVVFFFGGGGWDGGIERCSVAFEIEIERSVRWAGRRASICCIQHDNVEKFYQNSGSSRVYSNRTLHPSVLDRKTVSVCFSWPSGTTG